MVDAAALHARYDALRSDFLQIAARYQQLIDGGDVADRSARRKLLDDVRTFRLRMREYRADVVAYHRDLMAPWLA